MFAQSNYKMDNVYSAVNSVIQSVDQDNVFILSTGSNLSLLENKLINFLLSCIRMDDESFRTMLVTYDAIYRIFDYDTGKRGRIDRIDKLVTGLKGKTIHITPYPGCPYAAGEFPWFEICEKVEDETWDGKELYRFKFHEKLTPFLLNLKKNFTKCNYSLIQSFTNKYSAKLFMILSTEKPGYAVEHQYDKLTFILGYKDLDNLEKKPQFSNFKRDVLEGAMQELKEKAGIYATVNYKKSSYRSVSSVCFTVLSKSQKKRIVSENPLPDVAFCVNGFTGEKCCLINVGNTFSRVQRYNLDTEVQEEEAQPFLRVVSAN